jgi:choline dehydrogenase-like flavoprotein
MQQYDAIVIGSGISGGWAAKELCEKGLTTLVLERGRMVEHIKDYPTANNHPWDEPHRGNSTLKARLENPVQSTIYAWTPESRQFFVEDLEQPYVQVKPFGWIRGNQVGGRSLVWGRQSYRLSDLDFEANAKDGYGVDWPIRYRDLAPWYDYVERFAGISGSAEGIPHLPDGVFLPPMEMNCLELEVKKRLEKVYGSGRKLIMGRVANLTRKIEDRGPCQYRNRCHVGCPFSGYFSSNSATLPAAAKTGRLTLRPDSIVTEILYDKDKKRCVGVRIIDAQTFEYREYYARLIFLNASTIATAAILLQSVSDHFPNGIGNNYDQVGRYLMNHHLGIGASGIWDGFEDRYYFGRRANGPYLPRFRNLGDHESENSNYVRGFAYQTYANREGWNRETEFAIGEDLKADLTEPGPWTMSFNGYGEVLPYNDNKISLHPTQKDKWGQPLVVIDCEIKENEWAMRKDMMDSAAEMLERVGFKNIRTFDRAQDPKGRVLSVHEMGTARMGKDEKTSVLNAFNQIHDAKNLFITDGACMTSSACQNPSLTYMALTARACDYAVKALKRGEI